MPEFSPLLECSPSSELLEKVSRTLSPVEIFQLLQMSLDKDNENDTSLADSENDISLTEVDLDPNKIEEEMKDFREEKNIQFNHEITEIVGSVNIEEDGIEDGKGEDSELIRIVEKVAERETSPQQNSNQIKAPRLLLIKPPVKPPKDAPYIKPAKEIPNDKPYMIISTASNGIHKPVPDTDGSNNSPFNKPFKEIPHGKVVAHHNVSNSLPNRISSTNNLSLEGTSVASALAPLTPIVNPIYTGPSTFQTKVSSINKRVNILAMQNDLQSTFSSAFVNEGRAIGIHSATHCPSCDYVMLEEEVTFVNFTHSNSN
jgi:hypothetical protein